MIGCKNKSKYLDSKKEALDYTLWRTSFGREYGPSYDKTYNECRTSDGKFNFCNDENIGINLRQNNLKTIVNGTIRILKIRN